MTSSCSTYGTQPGDTGNQITAANIAYDNTVTGGDCAHVQCYLEYIGTAYEPLIGIIDAHIADLANPHQVFLDQVMDVSANSPLNGTVLTFNDSNNTFEMVAPVTGVTDHLLLSNIGVNDHTAIDAHIDSTNNPHSVAIVDIPHNIEDHQDVSILNAAIGETLEWVGSRWENKAPAVQSPTGYKNVIINGRLGDVTDPWIINQRGFDGNWAGLAGFEYGYDRWFRREAPAGIEQRVEEANIIEGATYTFSWDGGGTGIIYNKTGSQLVSAESPITIPLITSSPTRIYYNFHVPNTSTNVQLELGTVPTAFEIRPIGLELSLCQRYFWQTQDTIIAPPSRGGATANRALTAPFKVTMRVAPTISAAYDLWAPGLSVTTEMVSFSGIADNSTDDATVANIIADAEII